MPPKRPCKLCSSCDLWAAACWPAEPGFLHAAPMGASLKCLFRGERKKTLRNAELISAAEDDVISLKGEDICSIYGKYSGHTSRHRNFPGFLIYLGAPKCVRATHAHVCVCVYYT